MPFRFRRSIRLAPGVRLNFGKKSVSTSIGMKGFHVTTGSSGTRVSAGLPGTGISYTEKIGQKKATGGRRRAKPALAVPMVTAAGNEKVVTKKRETSGVFWLTFLAIFALATVAFRSGTPPAITPSVATTTAAPARAPASCAPLSNLVIVGQTPARSSGSAAPTTGLPSCSAAPSSSDNGFAYQAPVTPGYGVTSSTTGLPRTNYVSGYTRSNGTYVHPYYRSSR